MRFNNLIFIIFLSGLWGCGLGQANEPRNTERDSNVGNSAYFQSTLDSIYAAHPEAIGIMAHVESPDRQISWSGAAGYSELATKQELLPNQPALIASSIKTYIAAAILRLQEQHMLTIEDDIGAHLSKATYALFEADGYDFDSIKIKHLLSHTSGIQDYADDAYLDRVDQNPTYRWTRDEQLQLTTQVGDPLGKPEQTFSYADANFLLATEIIEQVTDQPFYTAMRALLKYDSLNLDHTWFPTLEDKPAGTSPRVHQYWTERNWDSNDHDISWDLYGGGGIATTTEELARFSHNLFTGNIIEDPETLNLIFTNIPTTEGGTIDYFLGLSGSEIDGLTAYGHGGFWGTTVLFFPDLDTSISVFILDRSNRELQTSVLEELVKALRKIS